MVQSNKRQYIGLKLETDWVNPIFLDNYYFIFKLDKGKVCQGNNSDTFKGKPIGSEEFFNQVFEVLGIIIDRRPKGRPRKREN